MTQFLDSAMAGAEGCGPLLVGCASRPFRRRPALVQLCAALGMLGLAYVAFFRDGLTFVGSASLAARCPGLLLASSQGTPCRRAAEESSAHAAATASSASFLSGVSTASVALAAAAAAAALKFGGSRRSRSLKPRLSITGCRGAVLNRADKVEESKDKHEDDIECNKVQQAEEGVAPASSREALEQMQTSDAPAADSTSSEAPAAALTSSDASAAQCEEGDKEGDKSNGFSMVFRFAGALWETFVDVATSRSPSDGKKWEYRKGIEGMSLGSLSYEMLTVSKDSADFQELEKVYETGWGVPHTEVSLVQTAYPSNSLRYFLTNSAMKSSVAVIVFLANAVAVEAVGASSLRTSQAALSNAPSPWLSFLADSWSIAGLPNQEMGLEKLETQLQTLRRAQKMLNDLFKTFDQCSPPNVSTAINYTLTNETIHGTFNCLEKLEKKTHESTECMFELQQCVLTPECCTHLIQEGDCTEASNRSVRRKVRARVDLVLCLQVHVRSMCVQDDLSAVALELERRLREYDGSADACKQPKQKCHRVTNCDDEVYAAEEKWRDYDVCYETAKENLLQSEANQKILVDSRGQEWRVLLRIDCLFGALESTDVTAEVEKCIAKNYAKTIHDKVITENCWSALESPHMCPATTPALVTPGPSSTAAPAAPAAPVAVSGAETSLDMGM
ncbi:unnamed protein product [Polarella glacialis]|uniref:Uncharacterized protein n=1 Tax=Polarella glacialis TaxID=89957 RepID=A0A813I041_POLGL|nr:unnamed protein product [Polarella glacialis]